MIDSKKRNLCFSRIAEGNKKAFDDFFEHYYSDLIKFALNYVNHLEQAEDIVADVLTNMLIHRQRVFALEHFESYLFSSVKNKALNYINKRNRTDLYKQEVKAYKPLENSISDPYELLVEKELRIRILKIIKDFPPKRKMVYYLIKEEKHSYKQVAQIMRISERTVEVHLKLAMKDLRHGIEQYLNLKEAKMTVKNFVVVLIAFLFTYEQYV